MIRRLVAMIAVPAALSAQSNDVPTSVRREIGALLDSTVAAGRRADTATVRRLVVPEFTFIHSSARVDSIAGFLAFVTSVRQDSVRDLSPASYHRYGTTIVVTSHQATLVPRRGWTAFEATDVVVRTPTARSSGDSVWRWVTHQSTAVPEMPSAFVTLPDTVLDEYVGDFENQSGFVRSVRRDGSRLSITATAGGSLPYRAVTPSTFHVERGDAYAVFVRDADGRVIALEILQPGSAERFTRVHNSRR